MSDDAEMMVPFYIAANATLRGRVEAAEALAGDLAQAGAKAEVEIDALRARVEAAEGRVAQAEAAGYRRAIDDACAALGRRYDVLTHRLVEDDHYGAGRLRGLDLAEEIVRALALDVVTR